MLALEEAKYSALQGLPWSRILAGWSMLPSQYPITTVWLTAWPSKHLQMILSGCQAHCQLQCYCASLQAGIALVFFASLASNTSSITFSGMYRFCKVLSQQQRHLCFIRRSRCRVYCLLSQFESFISGRSSCRTYCLIFQFSLRQYKVSHSMTLEHSDRAKNFNKQTNGTL